MPAKKAPPKTTTPPKAAPSAEELRKLALAATADPDALAGLDEDQITAIRREINPAGGSHGLADKVFVNMSIVDWSDMARRRFLMMSLIGFMSRMISEYEPEDEYAAIRDQYRDRIAATADPQQQQQLRDEQTRECDFIRDTYRRFARKVFQRHFEFDPDVHVRVSKTSSLGDSERVKLTEQIHSELAADKLAAAEAALNKPTAYETLRKLVLTAHSDIAGADKHAYAIAREATTLATLCTQTSALSGTTSPLTDAIETHSAILLKHAARLRAVKDSLAKVAGPLSAAECVDAVTCNPPADVFHQYERYMANHFPFLTACQLAYWHEKPDLESMVIVHSAHPDADAAAQFCKQHAREFRTQVFTVESGYPTLLGPYNENRERVAYYGQNTEVLKRLQEQSEADTKLGHDMLEKRAQVKKRQNIREVGPEPKGFKQYRGFEAGNTEGVAAHGAKRAVSDEKQKEMATQAQQTQLPPTAVAAGDLARLASALGANTAQTPAKPPVNTAQAVVPAVQTPASAIAAPHSPAAAAIAPADTDAQGANTSSSSPAPANTGERVPFVPKDAPVTEEVQKMIDGTNGGITPGPDALEAMKRNAAMDNQWHIHNAAAIYKETPPVNEFDAARRTGNYTVNDTDGSDLPPDAIHCEMFVPVQDPVTGEISMTKRMFATQAEAPAHLERNSPFTEQYQ